MSTGMKEEATKRKVPTLGRGRNVVLLDVLLLECFSWLSHDHRLIAAQVHWHWRKLVYDKDSRPKLWMPPQSLRPTGRCHKLLSDELGVGDLCSCEVYVMWRRWSHNRSLARAYHLFDLGQTDAALREENRVSELRLSQTTGLDGWFAMAPWMDRAGASAAWLKPRMLFELPEVARRPRSCNEQITGVKSAYLYKQARGAKADQFRTFKNTTVAELLGFKGRPEPGCRHLTIEVLPLTRSFPLTGAPAVDGAEWGGTITSELRRRVELAHDVLCCYLDARSFFSCNVRDARPLRIIRKLNCGECRSQLGWRRQPTDPGVIQVNSNAIAHHIKADYQAARSTNNRFFIPGSDCNEFYRLVVIQPLMYPGDNSDFEWCYSTRVHTDDDECSIVSTHNHEAYLSEMDAGLAVIRSVLSASFGMLFGLTACPNGPCLMNCSDSTGDEKKVGSFCTLCPSCMRATQLCGGFDDGTAVTCRLLELLADTERFPLRTQNTRRLKRERERLEGWLR
jgi:hypothetical protein